MNSVVLIGRLTKDVEVRRTNTGKPVASFTIAVQRDKENTDFINCVAWNGTAELLEKYTSKGHRLCLEGRIQTRTYDANDGRKVYVTEVVAHRVELLESKSKDPRAEHPQQTDNTLGQHGTTWGWEDDDIQF